MSFVPLIAYIGLLLALLCLWGAIRARRRQRLIDDVPTSRTTGIFIGLVELKGTAEAERPLTSYLAARPCVHYDWQVDEHWSRTVTETYTDSQGKTRTRTRRESGWTTVASGGERVVFFLKDEHGVVRVHPDGAQVEPENIFHETCGRSDPLYYGKGPPHGVPNSDHRRRFVERAIPLHDAIYVIGPAREREDVVAPEIHHDRDAAMFLISTRSEEKISAGYATQFWALGLLAVLLGVAGWMVRDRILEQPWGARWPVYAAAGGGVVGLWALSWLWMAYNSLVGLRQRVRQAWSNVDVQLKRRADLIPNLVRTVEALRDHERRVQTELTELRSQRGATQPGEAGPDPRGCKPLLMAIVEAYPELKADTSFLSLQRSLINTEQRIALAREYFNNIATFYNSRLEIVPDRYVAALARLRPQPLLVASDFERAPVEVKLIDDEPAQPYARRSS
jgi:hypothetical protein